MILYSAAEPNCITTSAFPISFAMLKPLPTAVPANAQPVFVALVPICSWIEHVLPLLQYTATLSPNVSSTALPTPTVASRVLTPPSLRLWIAHVPWPVISARFSPGSAGSTPHGHVLAEPEPADPDPDPDPDEPEPEPEPEPTFMLPSVPIAPPSVVALICA